MAMSEEDFVKATLSTIVRKTYKGNPYLQMTKHDDVLAALAVAENSHHMLDSAVENLIIAAKLTDSELFDKFKQTFEKQSQVLFFSTNKNFVHAFIDRFIEKFGMIDKF